MFFLKYFLFFFVTKHCVNSSKILAISHTSAYSHFTLANPLYKELAKKGHEVTLLTGYEDKTILKNYKALFMPEVFEYFNRIRDHLANIQWKSLVAMLLFIHEFTYNMTELTFQSAAVQNMLKSNEKFDLVIMEQFLSDAFRGFQHYYQAPCIVFQPSIPTVWVNDIVSNPDSPAYMPNLNTEFSTDMTFLQRLQNTLTYTVDYLMQYFYRYKIHDDLMHKYFPDAPHITDLIYNTSLVLLTSHGGSYSHPVPLQPNMIEVGGLHLKPPEKLPEDLQKFLDTAKEGVIYFSLGSNLKSRDMKPEMRDAILKTFAKLKEKVLWKWEDDTLPGKPDNVRIGKWLPQQEILAHPNVKLFITHGGILSTMETLYHGKPVLGIPRFADQMQNIKHAVVYGYGLRLKLEELNEDTFSVALNELLSNPMYSNNAKTKSKRIHDRPIKPLDNAVFWVEYVLRHDGAYHLQSSALKLKWYQYFLLDVIGFLLAVTCLPIVALTLIIKLSSQEYANSAD